MSATKSKHAFGPEANVDTALRNGAIDAYDILFLNEGKIGWIDKNGKKVILEDKQQVILLDSLPETGNNDVLYIYNNHIYLWDGERFVSPSGDGAVSESMVDSKIAAALVEARAYTDEQTAANSESVVEF